MFDAMTVIEKSPLLGFLEGLSQQDWLRALDELGSAIHPVDREATRIWFAFWPLDLQQALSSSKDPQEMARLMDLEGNWRLEEQIDSSVSFLYGAHFWPRVKNAVLAEAEAGPSLLVSTIRAVAHKVGAAERVDPSLAVGISAVGLMMLRQLGIERFERAKDTKAVPPLLPADPEKVLARRLRKSSDGLFTFLKGVNRSWDVRWEEKKSDGVIRAINGQDIAMAGEASGRDFRHVDYRRPAGPVPVECRVGSCGYCWIGLLAGRENLSPITSFERERLRYFGYDAVNSPDDSQPLIRLACQSQCQGDVTLAISPWNGELNRRHDEGRKKLGTA
jgi:ferredoxin